MAESRLNSSDNSKEIDIYFDMLDNKPNCTALIQSLDLTKVSFYKELIGREVSRLDNLAKIARTEDITKMGPAEKARRGIVRGTTVERTERYKKLNQALYEKLLLREADLRKSQKSQSDLLLEALQHIKTLEKSVAEQKEMIQKLQGDLEKQAVKLASVGISKEPDSLFRRRKSF